MARRHAPLSLPEAVKAGHRQALEAMRDKLAADMAIAEPAVVAQIAGRLQAVLRELADLGDAVEVNPLDDLAHRRARRESDSDAAAPARRPARRQPG
jgi:hypothetical protein